MGYTIAQKIIKEHMVGGSMAVGSKVALKIDQTLTQDATGTMAYLEFETMGIPRVRTELSVAYIDHNTIQSGFENADDHRFIQSMAKKYGLKRERPGFHPVHQLRRTSGGPGCRQRALRERAPRDGDGGGPAALPLPSGRSGPGPRDPHQRRAATEQLLTLSTSVFRIQSFG